MQRTYPANNLRNDGSGRVPGWIDLAVICTVFALLWLLVSLGEGMRVPFDATNVPALSLDVRLIPYYTGRTVLRMFIAFGASLLFTFIYGYVAAKSRAARTVMLPIIDILQSVPVLAFLSITVTGFIALFPGSLLGVECACIFAIFTSQAWNMTFGFYHSLVTIPPELQEAARVYRLNRWQRFSTVELPSSAIGLMWNSMMSFGGGWFFVSASEAIAVPSLNQNVKLPGLGSYMAAAVEAGDRRAAIYAIIAMVTTIVVIDQLLWRPLVAWAEKFKLEQTESAATQSSWVLDLLQSSFLLSWLSAHVWEPAGRGLGHLFSAGTDVSATVGSRTPPPLRRLAQVLGWLGLAALAVWLLFGLADLARQVRAGVSGAEMLHIAWLGFLTLLRVFAMTVLATLIWTPIGVWIGSKPRVARIAQPIAQIAASFPTNMTFPFIVALFLFTRIPINLGSILLIALGTQWYILFNVIAGAMSIPTDLKEAANIFGMRGWRLWKTLIIPAIFPFWVTGAVTAAGGAWNASIVAEVVSWGKNKLVADGLGAYIAQVTDSGNKPALYFAVVVMSIFVVGINRLLWRRLYDLAERRFTLA